MILRSALVSPAALSSVSRVLLQAIAMSAAVGSIHCGGQVVVTPGDDDDGQQGGGGAPSVNPTAGGGGETIVPPPPPNCQVTPVGELESFCFDLTGPCPNAATMIDAIQNEVSGRECEDTCCFFYASSVPCGPTEENGQCCYVADIVLEYGCEGRPFTIGGAATTASLTGRSDWCDRVEVDATSLGDEELEAIAAAWARSALAEHASVASFARFALELMSLGAPHDLVAAAHRAMGDEIAHATACFGVASRIAGTRLGPGPLAIDGAMTGRVDPVAVAVATVVEGCVGETLSAVLALAERDQASDPHIRATLDRIAADESEHAALAWRAVAWMIGEHGEPVRAAVERAFVEARPFHVEPGSLASVRPEVARAFGRLAGEDARAVLEAAMAEVVRPAARALFAGAPQLAANDALLS